MDSVCPQKKELGQMGKSYRQTDFEGGCLTEQLKKWNELQSLYSITGMMKAGDLRLTDSSDIDGRLLVRDLYFCTYEIKLCFMNWYS